MHTFAYQYHKDHRTYQRFLFCRSPPCDLLRRHIVAKSITFFFSTHTLCSCVQHSDLIVFVFLSFEKWIGIDYIKALTVHFSKENSVCFSFNRYYNYRSARACKCTNESKVTSLMSVSNFAKQCHVEYSNVSRNKNCCNPFFATRCR